MELWDYIARRLGVKQHNEIDCIKNIVQNTIVLNEYQTGDLSEEKLDMLVKLTGVYLGEVLEVMNSPDKFIQKLKDVNSKLLEARHERGRTAAV